MMNKLLNKRNILLCATIPTPLAEEYSLENYKKLRGLFIEDPWERVKSLFTKDDQECRHPELDNAIQRAEYGLIVGIMFGGTIEMFIKSSEYLHTSDMKIFQNVKEGQNAFMNYKMLAFMKGGSKHALPFAFFFGGFSLISSCCEAYRNKTSILNSTVAGGLIGGLCRFFLGFKGFVSGGLVGGVLGTLYGISVWIGTKAGNVNETELKHTQFAFAKYRKMQKDKMLSSKDELELAVEKMGKHVEHVYNPLDKLSSNETIQNVKLP